MIKFEKIVNGEKKIYTNIIDDTSLPDANNIENIYFDMHMGLGDFAYMYRENVQQAFHADANHFHYCKRYSFTQTSAYYSLVENAALLRMFRLYFYRVDTKLYGATTVSRNQLTTSTGQINVQDPTSIIYNKNIYAGDRIRVDFTSIPEMPGIYTGETVSIINYKHNNIDSDLLNDILVKRNIPIFDDSGQITIFNLGYNEYSACTICSPFKILNSVQDFTMGLRLKRSFFYKQSTGYIKQPSSTDLTFVGIGGSGLTPMIYIPGGTELYIYVPVNGNDRYYDLVEGYVYLRDTTKAVSSELAGLNKKGTLFQYIIH